MTHSTTHSSRTTQSPGASFAAYLSVGPVQRRVRTPLCWIWLLTTGCLPQLDQLNGTTPPEDDDTGRQVPAEGVSDDSSSASSTAGASSESGAPTHSSDSSSSEPTPVCANGRLDAQGFCVPEVRCAPGTFRAEMEGSSACAPCPSGSFSTDYDAEECSPWQDCAAGQFVAEPPTSSRDRVCETCPGVETTTVVNAGECTSIGDCPPGTFKDYDECIDCSAGNYCSGKSDHEVACEAGMWDHDQDSSTPCIVMTSCAAGQFVDSDGDPTTDRTCEFCTTGFSLQTNVSRCESWTTCEPGTYVRLQGTSASDRDCAACASGTFSDAADVTSCSAWTTCAAPTQYTETEPTDTSDRECGECPAGQTTSQDNASQCSVTPVNLVANSDFESNASGWVSWGGGTLSTTTAKAYTGSRSLVVSGPGTGPAATHLDSIAQAGASYAVSFWVSVGKVASSQVNITRSLTCNGQLTYLWLANHAAVPSNGWVELKGGLTIASDCVSPKLTVYAEGSGPNVDLYVDAVTVTKSP